jgi:hypothetical protein
MKKQFKTLITSLFLAFFILSNNNVNAQHLLVQYDNQRDIFRYFEVSRTNKTKEVFRPIVPRNGQIRVEVINFNPFIYNARATNSSRSFTSTGNLHFFHLINPLGLNMSGGNFLTQITENIDENARGGLFADPRASSTYQSVVQNYTSLYEAEQVVNSIDYVLEKINKLKYNAYLPADSIKKNTERLVASLMNSTAPQSIDFLRKGNQIQDAVVNGVQRMQQSSEQFLAAYQNYSNTRGRGGNFEGEGLNNTVQSWNMNVQKMYENYDHSDLVQKLTLLESEYQEIMNTPFVFNTTELAKGDELTIHLDFYHNPAGTESNQFVDVSQLTPFKQKDITVAVKGDMKLNTSLGLAFPGFTNNEDFFNRDSLIVRADGSNYTPNIAAYLNFYPYTGKSLTLGGSFGVGVPISTDNRNFNFLFGSSILLGTENKVAFHFGATLGQVNVLDRGFQVGDNIGSNVVDIPTRTAYNWGWFVGISFSVANLTGG